MSDTLSVILQWINTHPQLAGMATFIISAAESVAIIGTLVPGTVMMTAIGTLVGIGVIPLWPTLILAILGAIVGDGISYWAGRYFNERLKSIWPFRTHPNLLESGQTFFRNHGWMSVVIGRFVGPVRAIVPVIAGMMKMPPWQFTLANVISAIGWAPAYILPGILLGAASLELPSDVAIHVIFTLLATLLFIMLVIWLIRSFFKLLSKQIDQMLTWFWNKLHQSAYLHLITSLLKHHKPKKTYGQLILVFYFLCTCILLFYLFLYIYVSGSAHIFINHICFHFFRSLRTPAMDHFALAITFLGEKQVLLPLLVTLFIWLASTQRWRTAWHTLALGVLAAGGVRIIKLLAHSPRPWGLVQSPGTYSFPSGHATLTVAFYTGITFLMIHTLGIKKRRPLYYLTACIILAVSLSRLYLGVHWLTDIIGGWLLGAAVCMLVGLSYNRQAEKILRPTGILVTILVTLTLSYNWAVHRNFNRLEHDYALSAWPIHTVNLRNWWNQTGDHLPLYRINRFGLTTQILNLQWIGELATIQETLLRNGWELPPENNWIGVLHRLSDVESNEHLPLLAPLYLNTPPMLVMVKHMNGQKKFIILHLWNSYTTIENIRLPLWVGSIESVPRTYSWVFKNKQNQLALTPELLFKQTPPTDYDLRKFTLKLDRSFHPRMQSLLLVKPNTLPQKK